MRRERNGGRETHTEREGDTHREGERELYQTTQKKCQQFFFLVIKHYSCYVLLRTKNNVMPKFTMSKLKKKKNTQKICQER